MLKVLNFLFALVRILKSVEIDSLFLLPEFTLSPSLRMTPDSPPIVVYFVESE
ncbi:MAG: hypothetical protein ACD_77C00397G0001 [uncultured bacterium]|nr:MAG: hypothetical protein ACD_77C00397G0001 [uncultured bacterium]